MDLVLSFFFVFFSRQFLSTIMYSGFPKLPVSSAKEIIDDDTLATCSSWTTVPPARQVRLNYPALCRLLHISKMPGVRFGVFGRLYGAQIEGVVEIGTACMNLPKERIVDRENDEDRRKRLEEERKKEDAAFVAYENMLNDEFLDAYQVGLFVICSATFNPFSPHLIWQMMDLFLSSQPAVVLVYDPFRSSLLGKPFLKAYTLTDEFIAYATKLKEKQCVKEIRLLKEFGVTRSGVIREIPIELNVDAFHQLGLETVDVTPIAPPFTSIHSDAVKNYVEALLSHIQENTAKLTRGLDTEGKMLDKDHASDTPLGQSMETQLALFQLKEQTLHLEALCDSILLNSSIFREL